MKLKASIFIIVLLAICNFASAQENKKSEDLADSKILNESPIASGIIKLECLSVFAGRQEITFEQRISKKFSLQFGGGITFRPVRSLLTDSDSYSIGKSFSAGINYYYQEEVPNGFYTGLVYKYYDHKFTKTYSTTDLGTGDVKYIDYPDFEINNLIQARFGYQLLLQRLAMDFYGGWGIRHISSNKRNVEPDPFLPIGWFDFGFRIGYVLY